MHVHQVAKALRAKGESCQLVTNKNPDAQRVINLFRRSHCQWIIAVGMISEGTDIPRLQVCCYLSRIRTELHFQQVLGQVLRRTGQSNNKAWLFMLAEPTLQCLAERITDDLPEDLAELSSVPMPAPGSALDSVPGRASVEENEDQAKTHMDIHSPLKFQGAATSILASKDFSAQSNHQVSFSKHYRQQWLACFLCLCAEWMRIALEV